VTRKGYELIAGALALARPDAGPDTDVYVAWLQCVTSLSAALAAENPRFQRGRFLDACLVEQKESTDGQA